MASRVDPWGRTIVDYETVQELLLGGTALDDILVDDDLKIAAFNALLHQRGKDKFALKKAEVPNHTPEEEHRLRTEDWTLSLPGIDIREFVLSLCETDAQRERVNEEMDLYEAKDLLPILQVMILLVDHFRQNNIVWGVGRGSSVASYVLFLLGVHKIDAMKFGLSIKDFLKD